MPVRVHANEPRSRASAAQSLRPEKYAMRPAWYFLWSELRSPTTHYEIMFGSERSAPARSERGPPHSGGNYSPVTPTKIKSTTFVVFFVLHECVGLNQRRKRFEPQARGRRQYAGSRPRERAKGARQRSPVTPTRKIYHAKTAWYFLWAELRSSTTHYETYIHLRTNSKQKPLDIYQFIF